MNFFIWTCEWFEVLFELIIFWSSFRVPEVFNFSRLLKQRGQIKKYRIRPSNPGGPDNPYPTSVADFRSGFFATLRKLSNHAKENENLDFNHHESFDYQGLNYLIHSPYELFSKTSTVHQSIVNHSIIIHLNPQKTIIDAALENYKPKKFVID